MKTMGGHIVRLELPNARKAHAPFFLSLEKVPRHFSKLWKMPAPFLPLRQPMGGHGNPRKEHPMPHAV